MEHQQQQQQQQAAERQAQQARDAKEITGKRQSVQQAAGIAQRVNAEAAIEQQFDTAVEKGMQALDQRGYLSAEYQFKSALKIKPNDIEAKAGLLRAIVGAGRRAAAFTFANEQLLTLASKSPGTDGHSAYARWLEVLGDVGLTNDAEHSQLKRIYPYGDGDPERAKRAVASFLESNPQSHFLPFVHQIGSVLPAMSADYADRRREKEAKAIAEAKAKEELAVKLRSAAVAEAKAKEKAAARLRAATNTRGMVIKDCDICPDMATIPSGEFERGSNIFDAHSVNVNAFALGKTEVTQGQWRAMMGSNPSHFSSCGDDCPVEMVSWDDAQAYVKWLSNKTGKQYRLPSEAEWEYACRAGGQQEYCGSDNLDSVAWYNGNSGESTHPVSRKQPNVFGLYDMSGNVWEWVEDSYHDSYNGAPTNGSVWQGDGAQRVLRGGSWFNEPQFARAAYRSRYEPADRYDDLGFRVARMLP